MLFQDIKDAFQGRNFRATEQAFAFLHQKERSSVAYQLLKSGCKDADVQIEIFHDALIKFKGKVAKNEFRGNSMPEIRSWLKTAAFFLWTKHADNKKKEEIKRGRYGDEDFEDNTPTITLFDSQDPEQLSGIIHRIVDTSSIEHKELEAHLSERVNHIIDQMEEDCPERIRMSQYYVPAARPTSEKIRSKELAEDFGDNSAAMSRKKLFNCQDKLRTYIRRLLKVDEELRRLLNQRLNR